MLQLKLLQIDFSIQKNIFLSGEVKYFGINKSTIFKIFIITFDVLKGRHILTVKPYYVKIKNNNMFL